MHKRFFKIVFSVLSIFTIIFPSSVFADSSVSATLTSTASQSASIPIQYSEIDPALLNAVNASKFGFGGINSKSSISPLAVTPIAVITIFADPTSGGGGFSGGSGSSFGTHAFITVKNVSSGNIQIGKFAGILPGKTMSLGAWGNKSEHTGLWYNLEAYFVSHNASYAGRVSTSFIMTATQLAALNTYIINHDSWSLATNCSSFASGAWNSGVDASYSLSAGVPNTPLNLSNNLKSKFPGYSIGAAVPFDYIVYYAQGTGAPIASTIYI